MEVVEIGQVERWSKRGYVWKNGYTFRTGKTITYPWMTLSEIRVEAKKFGVRIPKNIPKHEVNHGSESK